MSIRDIADSTAGATKKGPPCTVCLALAEIPESEAAALRDLLANPSWRYTEISDRLAADPDTPLDIAHQTLARHATGRCSAREKLR